MTVRTRLLVTFLVVIAALALPATFAALRLAELETLAVEGRSRHATASLSVGRVRAALVRLDLYLRSYVAAPGPGAREELGTAISDLEGEVEILAASGYADAAGSLRPMVEALGASTDQIEELVEAGRLVDATAGFRRLRPLADRTEARLADAAADIDARARREFERAREIGARARRGTLLALGFGGAVAVLVGFWAAAALTAPLRRLADATARVADGDFRAPEDLPYDRSDEIGELSRSFRAMARRLAELDRMKAEFVGVASHELKTPINVIMGYAELIDDELAGQVTDEQHEILHSIAHQCRAMTRLVSRLMDISRLETGTYRLELEKVHVRDLITGLVRAFDVMADRRGVRLETEVEESAPETLRVDVDIIRDEVLGNLVSNALKFTPEGGEVKVSARGEGEAVVFRVADTGPGIPEDHREHVFEKYYQAERSRKMGSGLGLAIAQEMVVAHGGKIELVSAGGDGAGAVFEVTLPLRPSATENASVPPRQRPRHPSTGSDVPAPG